MNRFDPKLTMSTMVVLALSGAAYGAADKAPANAPKGMDGAGTAPAIIDRGETKMDVQVFEAIEKNSVTLAFKPGQSDLSEAERRSLNDFVRRVRGQAEVAKFVVAAWADTDYPATGELPEAAQKLADKRAEQVENALESAAKGTDVDDYEMTKAPNWFQKAFSTKEAEIKGQARSEWLTDEVVRQIGEKLRAKGGPGKVVVVARFKDQVVAH